MFLFKCWSSWPWNFWCSLLPLIQSHDCLMGGRWNMKTGTKMVSSNWWKYIMPREDSPFLMAAFPFPMVFFIHSFHLFLRIPFLTNFLLWVSSDFFFIHPAGLSSQHEKVSEMVSIYIYTASITIWCCPFEPFSPLQALFGEFKSFYSMCIDFYTRFFFLHHFHFSLDLPS